jgi:hypothetical protein
MFAAILLFWVLRNTLILMRHSDSFDPYPYILLNLFLSMLAAAQAPVILMSQNRQGVKDRLGLCLKSLDSQFFSARPLCLWVSVVDFTEQFLTTETQRHRGGTKNNPLT